MKNRGFTLIELLVVVAIISLLSSIVMVSVQDARNKAKVAQLKQDFIQIRNAAELYKNDTGNYPTLITDLVPNYLTKYPNNPFKTSGGTLLISPPSGGGGGIITIGLLQTKEIFFPIVNAQSIILIPTGPSTGYSFGLEADNFFCGRIANDSEKEVGKFFIYSTYNVGSKNVNLFNKFRVGSGTCVMGPCLPSLYFFNQEPNIYPCLD